MGLKIDRRAQKIFRAVGLIILAAIIFCLLKILIWEHSYYSNKSAETRSPEQSVITDLADALSPSEEKPSDENIKAHQTSLTEPKLLTIPRLELTSRVQITAVNEHILPVPDNIYDVCWYSGSSRPGQGGNILMSGISQGETKTGAFGNLDSLEKGDEIKIEIGKEDIFTYEVREIIIIDRNDAKNQLPIAQERIDDKETLALVATRRAGEDKDVFNSIIIVRATIK